ncbi:MAG: helix-turn-helix transcriptional regulator [Cyanobacteria bacterium]|nr:helix-turn-helix transcriptional regulator [Cyanobacteriota bacterium]
MSGSNEMFPPGGLEEITSLKKALGRRFKIARRQANLKQDQVAKVLQIPTSGISALENGQRKIDIFEVLALAKLYQKPLPWLLKSVPSLFQESSSSSIPLDKLDPLLKDCFEELSKLPHTRQHQIAFQIMGLLNP